MSSNFAKLPLLAVELSRIPGGTSQVTVLLEQALL